MEEIENKIFAQQLLDSDRLTEREKFFLRKRYLEDNTLGEIAKAFDVTKTRISQIEKAALRKLRHPRTWLK